MGGRRGLSGFKKNKQKKAWWTCSVNVSGFGPSLMRVIKSPYAENRKVNTDMYANWGLLIDVQAAASCLPTTVSIVLLAFSAASWPSSSLRGRSFSVSLLVRPHLP